MGVRLRVIVAERRVKEAIMTDLTVPPFQIGNLPRWQKRVRTTVLGNGVESTEGIQL